jgi:hypothetical protein
MPATEVDLRDYRPFTPCKLYFLRAIVLLRSDSTPRKLQRAVALASVAPASRRLRALSCHTTAAMVPTLLQYAATSVPQTSAREKIAGVAG